MPTIEIDHTALYYERTGHGPAILVVHGMCGYADVWSYQAHRLSDRYTCVRYDRRGHSRSSRGEATITDALHADDSAALIEALDLAPCLPLGSSGGAAIAVEVALRHGQLLRGAVWSVIDDTRRTATRPTPTSDSLICNRRPSKSPPTTWLPS